MKWNIPDIPEAEEVFRPIYKWYCLVALTMLYILVAIFVENRRVVYTTG